MSEFIKGFKTQDGSVKKYDFNSLGNTPEIVTKEEVDQIVVDALEQAEGPKGDTGATPDFSIGEVNTLAPGSKATASITGTPEAPILNLGIPRGADGSGGSGVGSLEELGVTATADELNYMDGVTSNVQTQLDNKANLTHVHGWSDITDKPFTEFRSDTVAWDCSTDGRAFAYLEADDAYFYKISDAIPTVSDLANGGSFLAFIEGNVLAEVPFAADTVLEIAEGVILVADTFFIIAESAVNVGLDDLGGLAFPEAGLYCPYLDGMEVELTINGYTGFVTAKIKPSCLPNSILFYATLDSDIAYLYKDASFAETSKLTCSELKNATLSGRPMYVTGSLEAGSLEEGSLATEEVYMLVTFCDFIFKNDLNYGVAVVTVSQGNGKALISSHFYTAEYTGGEVSVNG